MNPTKNIKRLIEADTLPDYSYFVEMEFASGSSLIDFQKALQDQSREKYAKAARAFLEMQIARGILKRESRLENALGLVNRAREKGKPHVSVALLGPEKKFDIKIPMPYEEVERLAEEFINSVSCPDFVCGVCIDTCPYNMIWTEKINCYYIHGTAYDLLKKYSGGSHKRAIHSLMKIRKMKG